MDANSIIIRLGADITEFSRNMRRASSDLDQFQQANRETFEAFKKVGAAVTAGGVAIAAGFTVAVKAAATYESAFAGVRKTVDASEAEFATLSKGIRNMAKELPAAASDIAQVTEAAGQLGIRKESLLSFTRTMVDLGVATNMSADEAATALARFANITNMSQGDFSKLGSTVVDLGNNFATTESEIVEMSLRLAGAGAQIGMSEADIMGLSAALSSVGIRAEMGGSAISRAMVNMQVATTSGFDKMNEITAKTGLTLRELQLSASNTPKHFTAVAESLGMTKTELNNVIKSGADLKNFAKISGMTGEEFKKAFETDAVGALGAFIDGLGNAEEHGESAINMLQDMGITSVLLRDSLLRAGNANKLFADAIGTANKAWEEDIALTKEAEERYKTFESKLAMFKNVITDVSITIGDALIPILSAMMEKLSGLITWVGNLNPKIIQTGAIFTAAAGALMLIVGPILLLIGFIPAIISGFGAIATVLGISGGAAGLFGATLAAVTGPIGLAVAAIAGITVAGLALANHLKNDAIPEVNRFGEGVSESTKKALGGFFELSDGASQSLSEMYLTSSKVTGEMATDLIGKYSEMNKQILGAMNERHAAQEESMKSFFLNSSVLTDEEEAKILQKQQNSHDLQVLSQELKEKRVKEILESASKEKRSLTQTEKDELNKIQQSMNENAVKYLTKNEVEQKVIMEKMKQSAGDLSAKQAAEVVKNSAKQRDEVVKEAEGQYNDAIAHIIRMRDETGEITADQAKKLIAEATRSRDGVVKQAENMHGDVVKEAKLQAGEHVDSVNWETGEILSKWDVFKGKTKTKFNEIAKGISDGWQKAKEWTSEKVESIRKAAADKFEDLKKSISDKMTDVKKKISEKWDEVMTFFKGIDLLQTGKDIVSGLVKGIGDMFGKVKTKISELANLIPEWARDILGIHSPSRVFIEIGKYIVEGLAGGISDSKRVVIDTMTGLLGVLVATSKSNASEVLAISKKAEKDRLAVQTDFAKKRAELARKTESSAQSALKTSKNKKGQIVTTGANNVYKIRANASAKLTKLNEDEAIKLAKISEKAAADTLKRSNQLSKEQLEAVKTYVADKKSLEELSIVAESEVWRRSIDLFKVGTKERVEAQKAYQASLKTINDEIVKTNDEYAGKMSAISENLRKQEDELTAAYAKSVDDRAKSLVSFASLFDFFEVKIEKTGGDLLDNLKSQVNGFVRWQQEIEELAHKAIDGGLIDELREMGPKALPELIALNSMTDKQLTEYSTLYRKKSELARQQAEKELVGMKADTQKRITELRATANVELEALRKDWVAKIKGVTSATNDEMMTLKKIGRQAAEGLKTGLESMEPALVRTATSIANAVKSAMAGAFDIHSPSRWMRDFIGVNMMTGWIDGMSSMKRDVLSMSANASGWMTPAVPKVAGYQTPVSGAGVGRAVVSGSNVGGSPSAVGITQHIAVHSPTALSPSEVARKTKQASQQLALEWRGR